MLVSDFAEVGVGGTVRLAMLHFVPTGAGVIFPIEFMCGELEYRTAGQKDAVLHGKARLQGESEFQPARILFSQYHQTASLKGLAVEGNVKLA